VRPTRDVPQDAARDRGDVNTLARVFQAAATTRAVDVEQQNSRRVIESRCCLFVPDDTVPQRRRRSRRH